MSPTSYRTAPPRDLFVTVFECFTIIARVFEKCNPFLIKRWMMDIIFCAGYRAEKINCKEWVKKTAVSSYTGGLHAILHRLYSGTLAALQMWAILWLVPDRNDQPQNTYAAA